MLSESRILWYRCSWDLGGGRSTYTYLSPHQKEGFEGLCVKEFINDKNLQFRDFPQTGVCLGAILLIMKIKKSTNSKMVL